MPQRLLTASTDYTQNVGGVNIGFIGYTNSSNGYSLDSDVECVLNTLNDYDAQSIETLCNRVSAMKDETDLVVVMLNFGSVESDSIETDQQALAQKLCDAGADLILGTGSRVMKPVEKLSSEDETVKAQEAVWCFMVWGHSFPERHMLPARRIQISVQFLILTSLGMILGKRRFRVLL